MLNMDGAGIAPAPFYIPAAGGNPCRPHPPNCQLLVCALDADYGYAFAAGAFAVGVGLGQGVGGQEFAEAAP